MKILILNTSQGGGAGIAARRQLEALRARGHDARFLWLSNDWKLKEAVVEHDDTEIRLRVPGAAGSFNSALVSAYCQDNRTALSDTWFSLWPSELAFDELLVEIAAGFDVVHLHWVSHLVSTRSLRLLAARGVRLVHTGHDMNPFTGGCHYTAGCERFVDGCSSCPQLRADPLALVDASYRAKRDALAGLPMTWVFPSAWLAREFERSALGAPAGGAAVVHNCIDLATWCPAEGSERQAQRAEWGFSDGDLVLVAGAQNNGERRKGFDFIEHALAEAERRLPAASDGRPVIVLTFGAGAPAIARRSPWLQHVHLGTLKEAQLPSLFRAADALLFPSREENFSNTILEALMCGCPVVAFAVGGVPEAVVDGENGVLVPRLEADAFTQAVAALLAPGRLAALRERTLAWHSAQLHRFAPHTIAAQLERLYRRAAAPVGTQEDSAPPHWQALCRGGALAPSRSTQLVDQLRHARQVGAQALYLGFCRPENNAEWGAVQWIAQDAVAMFHAPPGARPALVVQVPADGYPGSLLARAEGSMQVTLDGVAVQLHLARPADPVPGSHAYVVARATAPCDGAGWHQFALRFATLAVEPERDARLLCLLSSGSCIVPDAGDGPDEAWDLAACAAAMLRGCTVSSLNTEAHPAMAIGRAWHDLLAAEPAASPT